MKNKMSSNKGICIWLGIIAFLLFCGVLLFAAYVYKFDPLSPFFELFKADAEVFWSALNVLVTMGVGIAMVIVSLKLSKLQATQAYVETQQHLLQTEPHILVDSIDINVANWEMTSDQTKLKTLRNIDYPYYTNAFENDNLTDFSIITITIINTSEAFARLRFNEAIFNNTDENIIAKYNSTTVGVHKHHIMLKRGDSCQIGLLIDNKLLNKLSGVKFTLSTYLDNNFNECFIDEQSYYIFDVCEDKTSFMPSDISKNKFKKIE